MIYLDYSATTPVDKEVLDTFNKASSKISFLIVNFIFIPSFLKIISIINVENVDIYIIPLSYRIN